MYKRKKNSTKITFKDNYLQINAIKIKKNLKIIKLAKNLLFKHSRKIIKKMSKPENTNVSLVAGDDSCGTKKNMSSLYHIVGEIVLFSCIFAYFHIRTKTLNSKIDDLIQKTEEQDLIIQKHDHLLKLLLKKKSVKAPMSKNNPSKNSKPVMVINPIKEEEADDLDTSALLDMELESELGDLDLLVCEGNVCSLSSSFNNNKHSADETFTVTQIDELSENEQD